MAFGGVIKLQGESEYRKALSDITNSLKVVGSELKKVSSLYDKNDTSVEKLSSTNETLTKKLKLQGLTRTETSPTILFMRARTAIITSRIWRNLRTRRI